MKFSEKLQKLRKEKGYSQEQLADLLEVSRQSVSKWESGTTYPEMDKLLMLCKIFNVTLDDLTNDEVTDAAIKEKEKNKNTFNNVIYAILDMISNSIEMFKNMSKKELTRCVTEMLIVVVLLMFCSIPFEYVNDLARDIFLNFGPKAYSIIYSIWNFFTSIIYLVLFIAVLVHVYKTRYLDQFDVSKIKKEEEETESEVEEINEKSNKEEKKEPTHRNREKTSFVLFDVLGSIFNFIVKACLLFITLPIICVFFAFVFILIAAIILFVKGITYPGIIVGIIGCVLLSGLFMEIAIRFLVKAEFKFKKLFWIFVTGLVLCSAGTALSAFEIAETEIISDVPETEKTATKSYEFAMNNEMYIDLRPYYYYHNNVIFEVDETLTDKVSLSLEYYDNFVNTGAELNGKTIQIFYAESSNVLKNSFNLVIDNLKDKKIYYYSDLYDVEVTVKSSSANIETLKKNYEKFLEEKRKKEYELEIQYYDNRINVLEVENDTLREKNEELQNNLDEANEAITNLKDKILEIENLIK